MVLGSQSLAEDCTRERTQCGSVLKSVSYSLRIAKSGISWVVGSSTRWLGLDSNLWRGNFCDSGLGSFQPAHFSSSKFQTELCVQILPAPVVHLRSGCTDVPDSFFCIHSWCLRLNWWWSDLPCQGTCVLGRFDSLGSDNVLCSQDQINHALQKTST